ncbi:MAG: thiamine phosphate synthase [Armatimonadota bacterium]|nr:thiamine phosphate synthase [Armatimonadota bacterium]
MLAGVYVITDRFANLSLTHIDIVRYAVEGGASAVQLRDKQATTRQLWEWGLAIREITSRAKVLFFVNDRVDIALACEADGVHLGDDDLPVPAARRLLGAKRLIGRSVANEEEAIAAIRQGADYVSLGSIFATDTKPDAGPPVGLERLKKVRSVLPQDYPLVAIGGINLSNADKVFEAGADAVAVISAVAKADDPSQAVRSLLDLWRRIRGGDRG